MENPPFWWYLPGKMGIFMGYVSLPEGIGLYLYLSVATGCSSSNRPVRWSLSWFLFHHLPHECIYCPQTLGLVIFYSISRNQTQPQVSYRYGRAFNCYNPLAMQFYLFISSKVPTSQCYCWWKKSCTTWDVQKPVNNGIFTISTGARFQPSTVCLVLFLIVPSVPRL